ncbi:protein EVI2A [Mixophyes fleayi]|uniref:protein EVI2A n=1 Tax=Mixophyes fleayi TaxID=3061075 RepID=UPI003F4D8FE2
MKMMQFSLHLVILFVSFSCKAEVNQTDGLNNNTISTVTTKNSETPDYSFGEEHSTHLLLKTTHQLIQQLSNTTETWNITATDKMTPLTTNTETDGPTSNHKNGNINLTSNTKCTLKEDRYKPGIMICIIIIAVLVLICAVLITCSVALANKVSSLKRKLTQSKRQARSNGDFLSASNLLWPSGMETWQKKDQAANQIMDEIALGDPNNSSDNEKQKLMATLTLEKSRDTMEDRNTTSANDEIMTTISTVEI